MVAERSQPETREVFCTHCDRRIEIPATAMSVNCRHCNRRVIIENPLIKAYHAVVKLATAGRVEVKKKAQVVAKVRVGELVCHGEIKGSVISTGRVEVSRYGRIWGDVSCPTLAVEPGAQLRGHYRVDPDFVPSSEEPGAVSAARPGGNSLSTANAGE